MSEVVGLIEVEDTGYAPAEVAAAYQDATLDRFFARFSGKSAAELIDRAGSTPAPSMVVTANLDLLTDDLNTTARDVLARIFLTLAGR